ncbi:MAG: cysteine--tRNA ligase [Termitinemataceae bacterium]
MPMKLFNTLGREIQEFKPIHEKTVGFYGCGPTVYNFAHIGNLRAYVTHDLLVRALRHAGYQVTHVMNITDVGHLTGDADTGEDKMVKSAEERGKSVLEIANFYTDAFFKDTERLNILRPTIVCKATEHIQDMIELIQRIEARGYTYRAGGNLYFDITRFPNYGELAQLKLDDLKAGARIDVDQNKRNPFDFALWFTKSKFENQALTWDSPWGRGYPGWHIECSAMSMKYLGEQFDIHAGGIDHIPIHHTNEIAQSEAATGKKWVNYWVHNEFLVLDKGKMSKSSGSFLTLQSLIDAGYDALDYRYFLMGGHYRSQLQFSYPAMEGARNARKALLDRLRFLVEKAGTIPAGSDLAQQGVQVSRVEPGTKAAGYRDAFFKAIEDDLNTPRAIAELWGLLKDTDVQPLEALKVVFEMDEVLGLDLRTQISAQSEKTKLSPEQIAAIETRIAERTTAKKNRDFARADAIRAELKAQGILLEDTPAGTTWRLL